MSNNNTDFGICDHDEYKRCSCYKYYEDVKQNNNVVNHLHHFDRSGDSRRKLNNDSPPFSRRRPYNNNTNNNCNRTNTYIDMKINIKTLSSRDILSRGKKEQFFNHRATGRNTSDVEFIKRDNKIVSKL